MHHKCIKKKNLCWKVIAQTMQKIRRNFSFENRWNSPPDARNSVENIRTRRGRFKILRPAQRGCAQREERKQYEKLVGEDRGMRKPLSRPIFCTVETERCVPLALYVCRAPTTSSHFLKREIVPDRFGPLHRVWPTSWMPIIWSCVLADVRGIWMQRTQYLDDYRAAFVV